jgi:DNA-binding XRE family transcriptional regulator
MGPAAVSVDVRLPSRNRCLIVGIVGPNRERIGQADRGESAGTDKALRSCQSGWEADSRLCAYMFTLMMKAAVLLRGARTQAHLSVRALAQRAGVAVSTVQRIEQGQVDPTTGMLARLLQAAGQRLELTAAPWRGPQLASLTDAWRRGSSGDVRPDWTRLRAFLDHLALHPDDVAGATLGMPAPSGSELVDNLLAAIAEKLSDDVGLARPGWTGRVPGLSTSWTQPGTPRMREAIRLATPPQFAARGLTLDEKSLWRDRASVGV